MSADALCQPAFDAGRVRALQRATAMLCIAAALVLAGGALAKGLLFVTAAPNLMRPPREETTWPAQ